MCNKYSYSSYELHTRNFSHIHLSVLDASKLKNLMALQAKNVSGTFEKQALQFKPRPVNALGVMPA